MIQANNMEVVGDARAQEDEPNIKFVRCWDAMDDNNTLYRLYGGVIVSCVGLSYWSYRIMVKKCFQEIGPVAIEWISLPALLAMAALIKTTDECILNVVFGPVPERNPRREAQRSHHQFLYNGTMIAIVWMALCLVYANLGDLCQETSPPTDSPSPTNPPEPKPPSPPTDSPSPTNPPEPKPPQVTALLSIYDEANGVNWKMKTNWKSSEDVCDWYGIECNEDGKVTKLDLKDNNMYGKLSTSLGLLTDLVSIDLDSNYLTGTIPTELGLLTSLRHFEVDDNKLTGSIPSELGNLDHLKEVYLQTNNLSGTMPRELCARRIEKGGEVDTLIADCSGNGNPFGNPDIVCDCCSMCF